MTERGDAGDTGGSDEPRRPAESENDDALTRLREEQERRWQQFRTEQEEASRRMAGPSRPPAAAGGPTAPSGPDEPTRPVEPTPPVEPTRIEEPSRAEEPSPPSPPGPQPGQQPGERVPYTQQYQQEYGQQPPTYPQQPPGYGQGPGGWAAPPPAGGQQAWGGYPGGYGYGVRETEQSAVWAFVLSILAYLLCPVVLAIAALVLASNAKRAIAESHGMKDGEGMATAAQVIAWIHLALVALAVVAVVIVIAASATTYSTA